MALDTLPSYEFPIASATGGADFSIFMGLGVGGLELPDPRRALCAARGDCARALSNASCSVEPEFVPDQSANRNPLRHREPSLGGAHLAGVAFPVLDQTRSALRRNSGIAPRERTRSASVPEGSTPCLGFGEQHADGNRVGTHRRSSRSAALIDAPVDMTSSTRATRRPAATGTLARSKRRRWSLPVVIDLTGSADGVGQVDLRGLLEDEVVVDPERPAHLDRERESPWSRRKRRSRRRGPLSRSASSEAALAVKPTPWSTVMRRAMARSSAMRTSGQVDRLRADLVV